MRGAQAYDRAAIYQCSIHQRQLPRPRYVIPANGEIHARVMYRTRGPKIFFSTYEFAGETAGLSWKRETRMITRNGKRFIFLASVELLKKHFAIAYLCILLVFTNLFMKPYCPKSLS